MCEIHVICSVFSPGSPPPAGGQPGPGPLEVPLRLRGLIAGGGPFSRRDLSYPGGGLTPRWRHRSPWQEASLRSAVHASPSQRRMVGSWGHATQIQGMRGAQKANSHCGGHAPWATLSHSCSQPVTRLQPREGEPRGIGKLLRGRTELPTLQCPAGSSAFCLLLGQGPVRPQENPRPTPPSPLLSSLQTVTQRFSHLSTRPGPDAEPPSWGRGRSSKQACLYLI